MIYARDLSSDIYKGINYISPALFSFSGKEFFGKKKTKRILFLENWGKGG